MNFYLVHRNEAVVATVQEALNQDQSYQLLGHAATGREAMFFIQSNPVQVALVQLALEDMNGLTMVSQLTEKFPDLVIVPILEGNEGGDVWQHLMQLQLLQVINGPADAGTVAGVLQQAASEAEKRGGDEGPSRGQSFMVSVASARGGVGKSVFAVNLAICMARLQAETTLIDYSMCAGDFFTMLDHVPRNTMSDVIEAGTGIDPEFLTNLTADHSLGFKFLACPNQDFDFYGYDYESASNVLNISRNISEFVIVDTGVYDLPPTQAAIDVADLVFLVTSRDLSRLMALQRFIKSMQERDVLTEKLKVIVNNAEIGTEISENDIESVLEHPVTAYLPSIATLATFSINSGKPLAQTKPDHPFCAVVNRLAELSIQHWVDA